MNPMTAYLAEPAETDIQVTAIRLPRPVPLAGEVLVEVHAAGITKGELTWPTHWPATPSHELSGTVAELGPGVTEFSPGDEVYGLVPFDYEGAAAEYAVLPAAALAPKPAGIDHVQAASLPLAALTAWQALRCHARLLRGEHVLVHGGSGGVGNYLVQIAAAWGARVSATAAARAAGFVRSLGASQVVDYTTPFEHFLEDVDVVVDTAGGDTISRSLPLLRPGGRAVTVAAPPDQELIEELKTDVRYFIVEPDRAALGGIAQLVESGRLRPQVGKEVSFEQTPAALAALDWEHVRGKTVIRVR